MLRDGHGLRRGHAKGARGNSEHLDGVQRERLLLAVLLGGHIGDGDGGVFLKFENTYDELLIKNAENTLQNICL